MFFKRKIILFFLSLLTIIFFTAEAKHTDSYVLVAPTCLSKTLTHDQTLNTQNNISLIKTNKKGLHQLIQNKIKQKEPCGGFFDATEEWKRFHPQNVTTTDKAKLFLALYVMPIQTHSVPNPYSIKYETEVNQLLKQFNPNFMWVDLTMLTSFQDRFAFSENGVKAAEWIKSEIESLVKKSGRDDVEIYTIETGRYNQPSVIAKLGHSNEPGIVIGAHLDSITNWFSGRSPGADDDGSGTVTVLAAARTLLTSGMNFKRPIYFMWYAAEEMGLIGSTQVVSHFSKNNIPISAVLHLDMTGYVSHADPSIWLISDYVNKDLTAFLEELTKAYVNQPVKYTQCGYACSDHASWHKAGYAAAIPFEAPFSQDNPNIHTSHDNMDVLSLSHMSDFSKLAIAFAVELAEPDKRA